MQLEALLKKVRSQDHRSAYRAILKLRGADASLLDNRKPKDEQRRFQFEVARIVMCDGIQGLAQRWLSLGTDEQRRVLLHEIAQYWDEWDDPGTIELAIAALGEPDDKVRGYALICAKAAVESRWITPAHRARIARELVRAMAQHEERPLDLLWLDKYVELLGLVGDDSVLDRLERLLPVPGYRVSNRGTGLLEITVLETAIRRIRAR